jgi:hypothetical protein
MTTSGRGLGSFGAGLALHQQVTWTWDLVQGATVFGGLDSEAESMIATIMADWW